jgi:transcriptional regulator with XRE-family HTH domain
MKKRALEDFGDRLAEIRRSRGMTQTQLGEAVGVSNRVIHYYEQSDSQPPGAMLSDLARALGVSTDELLGLKPVKERMSARTARLIKRLQKVEELPAADQRALLKMLDALLETRGITKANGARQSHKQKPRASTAQHQRSLLHRQR